jgi:uncharacterized lipoprotein YajG
MNPVRVAALVLTAFVAFGAGCQTTQSVLGASARPAAARSQKDIAACEKMCEVAGDAEQNASAVAACKKDCRN